MDKGCSLIFPWMNLYFYLLVFDCTFYKMKLKDKIEPQHNNTKVLKPTHILIALQPDKLFQI